MAEQINEFTDRSGLVTVAVFRQRAGDMREIFHDVSVDVPEDMVCVGGGGEASEYPNGALLTASYPNGELSAWQVSSKSHHYPNPHQLTAYAIGLRIAGMRRDQLLNNIRVSAQDSGSALHPEVSATLPGEFHLISGGFKVEWFREGNLATASFPETSQSWMARSKAHKYPDAANLRAYAIGLRTVLPVGRVSRFIEDEESAYAGHPSATADVPDGFALTGAGARVNWAGYGNLLWKLIPTTQTSNQEVTAGSKDHEIASPATITTYALGIQIHEV